ncbi:MAG: amidase family protein [Pseudomonadota bacterium]|nr:amidase family protein [Pseudomonadota bacterium]
METIFAYLPPRTDPLADGAPPGLRTAIQPCLSVAGWPTDAGAPALADYAALEDATVVSRLRQAGATLVGLTRTGEFGFGLTGSQAGMAVRSGAADLELVVDLAGESRLAAARAGIWGFKPSWGTVSRFGVIGLIPSMECCGILAGDAPPIGEFLRAAAGPDERDFSLPDEEAPDLSGGRVAAGETTVGVVVEALDALPSPAREAFRASLATLTAAGFALREVSLPDFPLFALVHQIVGAVEASSSAGRYDSVRYGRRSPGAKNWNEMYLLSRGAAFGTLLKSYLFQGAYFQFEAYEAYENACRIRARLLAAMAAATSQADFLVLPATNPAAPAKAATPEDIYAQSRFTAFANVTGQPALYLPPPSGEDRPGWQLTGPRRSDARLLAAGEHLRGILQGGE